jgi:hypothetical protein
MLILLSTVAIAGVYVPGYVIFKTTNPITVIQTEPQLLTDKAWFNQKITDYHISELQQIGADKIPAAYLSDRLYYYAVFDTLYAVKDVINSMKGETDVVFAGFHRISLRVVLVYCIRCKEATTLYADKSG